MNPQHKAIRELLRVMSPNRAEKYITAFNLPDIERDSILLKEVKGLSYPQIEQALNMSPETLKRTRQRAFAKIADELNSL